MIKVLRMTRWVRTSTKIAMVAILLAIIAGGSLIALIAVAPHRIIERNDEGVIVAEVTKGSEWYLAEAVDTQRDAPQSIAETYDARLNDDEVQFSSSGG